MKKYSADKIYLIRSAADCWLPSSCSWAKIFINLIKQSKTVCRGWNVGTSNVCKSIGSLLCWCISINNICSAFKKFLNIGVFTSLDFCGNLGSSSSIKRLILFLMSSEVSL